MERIKQAIEKVKAQQPSQAGRPRPGSEGQRVSFSSPVSPVHEELGNIRYEYTRVIKPKMEHLERNRIVAFNKNDPKGVNFDFLRTHVLQKMDEKGWRTLAITSPTSGAGKTVLAINLAMSIAQQTNKTSMLVDFDLHRPKVGDYLGMPMEHSLNDMLDGTVELRDVLVNPELPRLVVLPTRNPVINSSETLSSVKIANLVADLRERYKSRIVIFDLPPILAADDVIALLPQVDCVLMVVANGMSTRKEIEDSLLLLPAEKLVGTVLNMADIVPHAYYYD